MQTQNFAKNSIVLMTYDGEILQSSEVVKDMEFMGQQTQNGYLEANQPQRVQERAADEFISSKEKEEQPKFLSDVLNKQKVERTNILQLGTSVYKRILDKTVAPEILSRRDPLLIPHNLLKVEKDSVFNASKIPNCCHQDFKGQLRGGSPQGDSEDSIDVSQSELIVKFLQHKEKVLKDRSLEKELNLFVEVLASNIPAHQDPGQANDENKSNENQALELSFDIRRHLLSFEGSEESKILLLTGQAGSGKSLFCKHFQRKILSEWFQNSEAEYKNWFPIYVELSSLKKPKSEAISESLTRELSLTKEEILLLQAPKQSNPHLPRLLFIFDGYDAIEDFHTLSLSTRQDFLENNFSMLNKIKDSSWKDAKFIITCGEENLEKVQRRDLLFAPLIKSKATELSTVPGSFLQRKIEPFSDEQITCYLKKYYYHASKDMAEEGSWNQVKVFEKMIDNYQLREIARIPFMLWIICQALCKIVKNESEQINEAKSNLSQKLSRRFLIDFFVEEVIRSRAKESKIAFNHAFNSLENKEEHKDIHKEDQQVNLHMRKIRQQAQDLALNLRGYATNYFADARSQHEDPSTLKLHPLVKWDNNHSRVKFVYPFLLEFFVPKSIEEEISHMVPSTTEDLLKMKKKLIINQRLLTCEASDTAVIFFLIDAIRDERLTSSQFIHLIYLSREKELNQENNDGEIPNASHSSSQAPFTIAASNAIIILNVAGYNFGPHDLTNINIPDVNLSFGIFEGTNFTGSNLNRVDFTGAWLKNANFVGANLESVEFGAIRKLKLQNEKIKDISYSPDGEYFAVGLGAETVIFDVVDMQKSQFKENKRFPGFFLGWRKLSRTQVVTIKEKRILAEEEKLEVEEEAEELEVEEEAEELEVEEEAEELELFFGEIELLFEEQVLQDDQKEKLNVCFCIWDAMSGQSIEELNVSLGNREFLNFDPDRKEVIAFDNKMVQKYDIHSQSWIRFPVKIGNDVKTRNLFARNSNTLLVGDYLRKTILCSLFTGKVILKQRQSVTCCKLSSSRLKMATGTSHGIIHISDYVRGYIIKSLINQSREEEEDDYKLKTILDCSFNEDGKKILSVTRKRLNLQDIAGFTLTNLSLPSEESNDLTYCLSPYGQLIAVVEEMHAISFQKFPTIFDLSIQTLAIRGTNNKGLNLQGIIVNNNGTLPEENITLFQEKGDYGMFNENVIKKLFSNSSADSEDVREVVLIGEKLAPIHARIIGSDLHWINL